MKKHLANLAMFNALALASVHLMHNDSPVQSSPYGKGHVDSDKEPVRELTEEEQSREFWKRYDEFRSDIQKGNDLRNSLSKNLKEFVMVEGVSIHTTSLKNAHKIFRKTLADNNLSVEQKT